MVTAMSAGSAVERLLDTRTVSVQSLLARAHSTPSSLAELLPILASPDSGRELHLDSSREILSDGEHNYPLRAGAPLLLPVRLHPFFSDRLAVPYSLQYDAFLQYFLLSSIKQSGEINAGSEDLHYQRHLHRLELFCRSCTGLVLDVGCDDPRVGAGLLPRETRYVGLDPFCSRTEPFRLVGVAEYLPFRDSSVDAVLFNTSLDHILDWHRALNEAHRVLVPGGRLYLCTIVWLDQADLLTDSVHFHHFTEEEMFSALKSYEIEDISRYDYKGARHRFGLYLSATKTVG